MAPFLPEAFSPEDRGASAAARSQRWTYVLLVERDARMVATFGGTLLASVLVVVLGAWLSLGDGYFDHTFILLAANPVHPLGTPACRRCPGLPGVRHADSRWGLEPRLSEPEMG